MIDLVFGDSQAGLLKVAKRLQNQKSGMTSVIGGSGFGRKKIWQKGMLGSPAEVASLALVLDMGDISGTCEGNMESRKRVLEKLFGRYDGAVADGLWRNSLETLEQLQMAEQSMEPVRIWVNRKDPGELCGCCFICHILQSKTIPLSVVWIPDTVEFRNRVITYRNTGEIEPDMLGYFVKRERLLSQIQRNRYAELWRALVCENAPLRAVVNGKLLSVPADFYDFALRMEIPDEEFSVAFLIGKTLGKLSGVSDFWLFGRIQEMLKSKELEEVVPAGEDHPYSAIVRKAKVEK